jgi:hypothetical protein
LTWKIFSNNREKQAWSNYNTLHDKRFDIKFDLRLNGNESEYLEVISLVTFYTPTNFKIEYLRVKWKGVIPEKNILIIDGRKDMVNFIDQEKEINKRVYSSHREPDKIDYKI